MTIQHRTGRQFRKNSWCSVHAPVCISRMNNETAMNTIRQKTSKSLNTNLNDSELMQALFSWNSPGLLFDTSLTELWL